MHAPLRDLLPTPRPWFGAALLGIALLAYAVFVWTHAVVIPAGADASGYFNVARLLSEGRLSEPVREIAGLPMHQMPAFLYVPLGFIPNLEAGMLVPTYPAGLPLLFAGSAALIGWQSGPLLVLVLHGVAGVLLTFALARAAGLHRGLAAICAAGVGISPVYVMFTLQAMSDVPALAWCALALVMALRPGWRAAVVCGFAIGIAVLIRPSNVLIGLPVLFASRLDWRRWFAIVLGGLPAAVTLVLFNRAVYGSPFKTGYGSFFDTLFSIDWVPRTLAHYVQWLPAALSPLIILVLAAPWGARGRLLVWVHGCWVLLVAGFYSAYYHTHETWWYLRFLLPIFPSLVVLAGIGGERLMENARPRLRRIVMFSAAAVVLLSGYHWCRHFAAHHSGFHERNYSTLVNMVAEEVPPDGVVMAMQASGALFHGTNLTLVRWDMIDHAWPQVRSAAADAGKQIYAALFAVEFERGFATAVPGNWRKLRESGQVSLWRLEDAP